ncbi:MAG: RloB domain-containing protein [Prevotella sp.]|nr:RloB domain-containing protein [Prevotella sp.]
MARKERISKGKTMSPNYFVFCEGDTEVAYTEMLRAHYRLPIHIIAKKTLLNITPALVERCKAVYVQTKNDKTYLMYDLDVATMLERLQKVTDAVLLCSNPCFELWLLLHYADQKTELKSGECVSKLIGVEKQYKKGVLSDDMKQHLVENQNTAIDRAKKLTAYNNPSTTVYQLIEDLEKLKKEQEEKNSMMKNEIIRNHG